ncbi:hypothetical protein [Algisphaera agarilytica]|uniref:Uncharacterized protein n=1 Tax=Algisphaera agarilytica TaxID=1385975 RepID=A0A7X0H7K0_9BACT|nr:hypothetical protein [Algisphaera agarilytica]MBB6430573.1 hypothetical protein [Algisphaera agarilytica]
MMDWRGVALCGFGLSGLLLGGVPAVDAQELIGAEAALKQWLEPQEEEATPEQEPAEDPLRADLKKFTEAWPAMSPEDAATGWIALYDRWAEAPKNEAGGFGDPYGFGGGFGGYRGQFGDDDESGPLTLPDVVRAIPGPDAWPALMDQVDAREAEEGKLTESALRLLVSYLDDDMDKFLAEAEQTIKTAQKAGSHYSEYLVEAIAPLTDIRGEQKEGVDEIRARIQRAKANPDAFYEFEVPDLVTLYGEDEARALLEEIVVLSVEGIGIEVGDATRQLATRIATEKIDDLAVPRWGLVWAVDEDNMALYEALDKKYGQKKKPQAEGGDEGLVDMIKQLGGFGQSRGFDPYYDNYEP